MSKIGLTIRKIRELRNYTQTYMSDKLDMSLSGYSKIERDETEISIKRLAQIAEILEIEINSILKFDQNTFFTLEQDQSHRLGDNNQPNSNLNLTEKLINQLQSENEFLRNLVNSKQNSL